MAPLDILYIVLSVFITVIGTLLAIFLYKAIKILNVLMEIVEIYEKIRELFSLYKLIPDIIINTIKNIIFSKKD